MMIETVDGTFVNSDTIRLICAAPAEPGASAKSKLISIDGDRSYTAYGDADTLAERMNTTIIPATPGFRLIILANERCEEFSFDLGGPVIAWSINPHGDTCPITPDPLETTGCVYEILCPDGSVVDPGGGRGPSANMAEWEASAQRRWQEDRAHWLATHPLEEVTV
jgi:hypothetical protein